MDPVTPEQVEAACRTMHADTPTDWDWMLKMTPFLASEEEDRMRTVLEDFQRAYPYFTKGNIGLDEYLGGGA